MRNRCLQILNAVALSAMFHAIALAEPPLEFSKFDKSHSTVGFHVPILGGMSQVEGKFMAFDVQLRYDAADPTKCMVGATIDASSINTGIADRDDHLRSDDFLNVAVTPKIMFISKKVEKIGEGLVVHGTLSMHGVSKPIDLAAEVKGLRTDSVSGDYLIGLHATTALNRQDFGITWKHADPLFVGDSIYVVIDLISKLTPAPDAH